jgi:ribonuclease-3
MTPSDTSALQQALGHTFANPELLLQALTHSSKAREAEAQQAQEDVRVPDNEQMEFLGDAVLSLVTSEELFQQFPAFREGDLSKLRAHLVSERHLVKIARQLDLGHYLLLGKGEEKSGGRRKTTLLVDALEAILAALYLDGGLEPARRLILERIVGPELKHLASNGKPVLLSDYKSALQEKLQAMGWPQPAYVLVGEQGPEHSKMFTIETSLPLHLPEGQPAFVGRGEGPTKKSAEQNAARQVLEYLAALPEDTSEELQRKVSHT